LADISKKTTAKKGDSAMLSLIIQLIAGVIGGNSAGATLKQYSLGPIGNSIAGLLGGIGGQLLGAIYSGAGVGGDKRSGSRGRNGYRRHARPTCRRRSEWRGGYPDCRAA
jgi:hypothetical protein